MINQLEKTILFRQLILVSQLKNLTIAQKVGEMEKKILDYGHDKYITIQEFNKLMTINFAVKLAQANIATKDDIVDFVKETEFDNKPKD